MFLWVETTCQAPGSATYNIQGMIISMRYRDHFSSEVLKEISCVLDWDVAWEDLICLESKITSLFEILLKKIMDLNISFPLAYKDLYS